MNLFYRFAQLISWLYFRIFHRMEVKGLHNIPSAGAFILASNHTSYFDPPALGCKLPRNLHYFARDSLFIWPLGLLIRNLNSIPVNRSQLDIATLKRVLKVLKSGDPLLVFPEGTRSPDGKLGGGKKRDWSFIGEISEQCFARKGRWWMSGTWQGYVDSENWS